MGSCKRFWHEREGKCCGHEKGKTEVHCLTIERKESNQFGSEGGGFRGGKGERGLELRSRPGASWTEDGVTRGKFGKAAVKNKKRWFAPR